MSAYVTRGNVLIVAGLTLVFLGWGAPEGQTLGPGTSPLAAVAPNWLAGLAGIGGWGLVALGLFLDGLPTPADEREWVPDESEMEEWDDERG